MNFERFGTSHDFLSLDEKRLVLVWHFFCHPRGKLYDEAAGCYQVARLSTLVAGAHITWSARRRVSLLLTLAAHAPVRIERTSSALRKPLRVSKQRDSGAIVIVNWTETAKSHRSDPTFERREHIQHLILQDYML